MKKFLYLTFISGLLIIFAGCSTTKSKDEVKGFKKFYHNTTSKFNGFFNAEELMRESMEQLQAMHLDNYNEILSVYDYTGVQNPGPVTANLDKAIEKVSTVATIHDIGNYVDDCYVLIGKAQYLKQDYIGAEETFKYFEEMFDPKNPYGRVYKKGSSSSGRKTKRELRQERKRMEKERKEEAKEREKELEEQRKAREEERKERNEKAKERRKNSKRGRRSDSSEQEDETEKSLTREEREKKREQEKALEELKKQQEEEEARRKELEEEKEEDYKKQGKGAIFRDKTAYTLGLYWMARTYIETERFSSAAYMIERLENIVGLSGDISDMIPAAKADLYLKTKEYNKALVALEDAINSEKDKSNKARYAFIRAQIFEKQDNIALAFGEYNRAKKFSPDYEMKFNAELNELKLSYSTGRTTKEKALEKLYKMLEENKNDPYSDQIFFTIAEIQLESGDIDSAIASFESAVSSGSKNQLVKLEAYYKLAELLFDQGLYARSKENYDLALRMMPLTDPRYKTVERLSKNLDEIAMNIGVVRLQDSLLRLSLLSPEELTEIAKKNLAEKQAAGPDPADSPESRHSNIITSNRQLGAGRSNFFAYNPLALNQGKTEFKRVWGDRVLEDKWRRSLRADATLSGDYVEDVNIAREEADFSDEELRIALQNVPRNDIQKKSAHVKIQNALFQLGILFRERLRNYEKSIEVLERLVKEYPEFEKRDEALFYLYLSYLDISQDVKANQVTRKMRNEFPDSKFTRLAIDPNYAQSLLENQMTIENYYSETYRIFEKGNHDEVVRRVDEKERLFPNVNEYGAKFDMIKAMSLGNLEGQEKYIDELEKLIRKYPKSPEEARAKEILRFLKGDREAFDQIIYDEALEQFTTEDDKLHYVFIVVYDLNQRDFDQTKIDINNYNKKYHRFDNLKTSNIYLNQENRAQIILIRSFDDKEEAMKYYESVQANKSEFIKNDATSYEIFPSTQKNYREVIKQQGISSYRVFFEENYLKN